MIVATRLSGAWCETSMVPTIVTPYLVVGGTDSRHYYRISDNVYRFGPFILGRETMRLAHGTNERISVDNLVNAVRFYRQLLITSAGPDQPSSE